MSQATNTKLMSTEAGGEQTQYEGINTFTKPHVKEDGQFNAADQSHCADNSTSEARIQAQQDKLARDEKSAENSRYGEAISEHGFGGKTLGSSGSTQQGGYSRTEGIEKDSVNQTRREQGYGGGNDVGA